MAVRQYIGARYVPIFGRKDEESIEWDNTKPYEPLTIVLHQGNSFTSRQYVPVGIDITNEDYWALTGNYNAQVEAYRAEVQGFSSDISTLQDQMAGTEDSTLKTAIDANTENVATLQDQMAGTQESTLKTAIDANTENVATLQDQMAGTQDSGLLTLINGNLKNKAAAIFGGYLAPSYVGDFMADLQFSACCRVGDEMYCFAQDSYDGTGNARIYNLTSNALVSSKTILMGHANSVAYDSVRECIWIAPMNTYTAGVASQITYMYKYTLNLNAKDDVYLPDNSRPIYGVSFDPVTECMYAFVCPDYYAGPIMIYRMQSDENAFTLWKTIPVIDEFESFGDIVWQDFAVYNNVLVAAKAEGTVYCFDLTRETIDSVDYTLRIGKRDAGNIWTYGEIEGLEFDANGRLYNARNAIMGRTNSGKHHNYNGCFVTELNTATQVQTEYSSKQSVYGTLDLDDDFSDKFALGRSEIRSLNQLYWRNQKAGTVAVRSGKTYTDEEVRLVLDNPLCLHIYGTVSLNNILLNAGHLFIFNEGTMTFSNSYQAIMATDSAAILYLRNRGTINVPNANRFIHNGYSPNIICIGELGTLVGDNAHKFGDVTVSSTGMLMGNGRVMGTT